MELQTIAMYHRQLSRQESLSGPILTMDTRDDYRFAGGHCLFKQFPDPSFFNSSACILESNVSANVEGKQEGIFSFPLNTSSNFTTG